MSSSFGEPRHEPQCECRRGYEGRRSWICRRVCSCSCLYTIGSKSRFPSPRSVTRQPTHNHQDPARLPHPAGRLLWRSAPRLAHPIAVPPEKNATQVEQTLSWFEPLDFSDHPHIPCDHGREQRRVDPSFQRIFPSRSGRQSRGRKEWRPSPLPTTTTRIRRWGEPLIEQRFCVGHSLRAFIRFADASTVRRVCVSSL